MEGTQGLSPLPGHLLSYVTPWTAHPLGNLPPAFQIMLTHLIKFPQCPQIKFKADGSPEGPFRPSTCLWHPPAALGTLLPLHPFLALWIPQAWNLTTH